MSKSKPTHLDQIFELKRVIKEHEETIKKLYRKLNNEIKAEKHAAKKAKKAPQPKTEPKEDRCPNCETGKIRVTDLGARKLHTCTECSYRKTTK